MPHVLVTGGSGFLGSHVVRLLVSQGHDVVATHGAHPEHVPEGATAVPLDLGDDGSLEAAFRAAWPEVVIHTAAMTEAKPCELDPDLARRVNVAATGRLARMCNTFGARLIHFSTDQVFAGDAGPYDEDAPTGPLQTYGATKLEAEREVRRANRHATIVRVALAYGASPTGDRSASERLVRELRGGGRPRLFTDEYRSPILADDLAEMVAALIPAQGVPLLHLGGPDRVSRLEFGQELARAFGLPEELLQGVSLDDVDIMPARPRDVSLDIRRLRAAVSREPRGLREGLRHLAAVEAGASGDRDARGPER